MKYFILIIVAIMSLSVRASTNTNVVFIHQIDKQKENYTEAELKEWNLGKGDPIIPESASLKNLEHVKLLLAANPDRYEAYAFYGLHFYLKKDWETSALAYEKAVEIIQRNSIDDKLDCKHNYSFSLLMAYAQKRGTNKKESLMYFDKLIDYNFSFFTEDPELATTIHMAVLDYHEAGRSKDADALMERTKKHPALVDKIVKMLESQQK